MNPNDLKQILDALTYADVREFSLRTGSFDLSLKRGPQAFAAPAPLTGPAPALAPMPVSAPAFAPMPAPAAPAPQAQDSAPAAPAQAAAPAPAPAAETPAEKPASKGTPVKAPIVGTFYASSSPDAAPYVKVGDTVAAGQVLCIIEAMKLMNEIEAEQGGTIREILVKNAEPVEYGQTLFIIE
ncbi:acetyl-CoA carboxylase biotin carboxyl carrier protein [Deinococcus soli (ex Cha et al. 2016)]|uniref:Biotin carboxyl carrier protein of acetyl-CoA carboxylase n=2 Tax=Deinococcus soli (ex Cha et al. 2016) TaxID=1309411 RepID=A0AAE3XGM9_9DEIO|nr:acetyl-CoA carboxylase biotin carboxyl carrier protein [Deinococcus soli (ex Cha et al. 2016)]MDR6220157.1 acetyl-CoA carboxylase biotin carboxyl carrier protein [Deinococcus soli (ex Cha et al. 2016)]MDR6330012.1 acetyl-CoA carboxylase biotin carboxyl carrier protein [Deinococcus soli (ex Cha et al. 2016)]MDR6753357.1 acetyl-CoA carboxylase biotin carboxyl carrier protein [Deinococcus soli (ex Cha et al. 2016)]